MKLPTNTTQVSSRDFRHNIGHYIEESRTNKKRFVIQKRDQELIAIVPISDLEKLKALEEEHQVETMYKVLKDEFLGAGDPTVTDASSRIDELAYGNSNE